MPLCKIILCYFHIIQNCERKSPQLRNKKKDLKKGALDLLVNIKLLLFKIILKYFSKKLLKHLKVNSLNSLKIFIKIISLNF